MTLQCPICHVAFIREVLEQYEVQARHDGVTQVGGLQVLNCINGHVFFIRKSDVASEKVSGAAA